MSHMLAQEHQQESFKILIVEDDHNLREALDDTLQLAGYDVLVADSAEQAILFLKEDTPIRLIISDVNMGGMSGYDLLKQVKQEYPQIPMLLITAYASITDSVAAIKEGAVDYLVKPFEPEVLLETVAKHLGSNQNANDKPIAVAQSSIQLLQLAERVAESESTVLIIGESGTGKEVLARFIHDSSPRKNKPFIAINCAAIPESMLESMLFGHEKGAYTGAHTSSPGKFEMAEGGTLLLDEISEMDINLQAKLLRVLQEREVERLGGRKTIKLNVRVIATSNRDMAQTVMQGQFREDLYFRLSVLPLQWAPLRDRVEDIVPLAEQLLNNHVKKQNRQPALLDESSKQALQAYGWPGNVRELDNIMQRALIFQPNNCICAQDLGLQRGQEYSAKPSLFTGAESAVSSDVDSQVNIDRTQVQRPVNNDNSLAVKPAILGSDLRKREYEIIMETLKQENGSRKNTAERLGISARTLRYKMARLREDGFSLV